MAAGQGGREDPGRKAGKNGRFWGPESEPRDAGFVFPPGLIERPPILAESVKIEFNKIRFTFNDRSFRQEIFFLP